MTMRSSGDEPYSWEERPTTTEQVRRFGPPAIITLAALLFVFQNAEKAKFEFLWFDFEMPMWVMLIVFAGVGAVVLYGVQRRRRRAAKSD